MNNQANQASMPEAIDDPVMTLDELLEHSRGEALTDDHLANLKGELLHHNIQLGEARERHKKANIERFLHRLHSYSRAQDRRLAAYMQSRGIDHQPIYATANLYAAEHAADAAALMSEVAEEPQ